MRARLPDDPTAGRVVAKLKTPSLRIVLREHAGHRSLVAHRPDRGRAWMALRLSEAPDGFRCVELHPAKADDRPAWLRRMRPDRRAQYHWDGWTCLLAETGIHPASPAARGGAPIRAFLREALGDAGMRTLSRLGWVDRRMMGHLVGRSPEDAGVRRLIDLAPCFAHLVRADPFVGLRDSAREVGWSGIGVFDVSGPGLKARRIVPDWLADVSHSKLPDYPLDLRVMRMALQVGNAAAPSGPAEWDAFCKLVVATSQAYPEAWYQAEFADHGTAGSPKGASAEWAVFARVGIPTHGCWASRMAALDAIGGCPRDHHTMVKALLIDLLLPLSLEGRDPRVVRTFVDFRDVTHAVILKAVVLLGTGDSLEAALSAAASWVEAGRPGHAAARHGCTALPSPEAAYARWSRFLVDPCRRIDDFLLTPGFRTFRECLGDWGR